MFCRVCLSCSPQAIQVVVAIFLLLLESSDDQSCITNIIPLPTISVAASLGDDERREQAAKVMNSTVLARASNAAHTICTSLGADRCRAHDLHLSVLGAGGFSDAAHVWPR
jgi:hypothetical protein